MQCRVCGCGASDSSRGDRAHNRHVTAQMLTLIAYLANHYSLVCWILDSQRCLLRLLMPNLMNTQRLNGPANRGAASAPCCQGYTAVQPYSHAAIQSCSHAAIQPYSHLVLADCCNAILISCSSHTAKSPVDRINDAEHGANVWQRVVGFGLHVSDVPS